MSACAAAQLVSLQQEDVEVMQEHAHAGATPGSRAAPLRAADDGAEVVHAARMARVGALQAALGRERAQLAACKAQLQAAVAAAEDRGPREGEGHPCALPGPGSA